MLIRTGAVPGRIHLLICHRRFALGRFPAKTAFQQMNYVAHALLAPREPIGLLGNLLGDFVKGPLPGELAPDLAAAVAQHRAIDRFCDRHPGFVASRRRLFGGFSHYAGVIVDVVFDHLLCADWGAWSEEGSDEFVDRVYGVIEGYAGELPSELGRHARQLVEWDALRRYRSEDDLRSALARMSRRRLKRPVRLDDAVDVVVRDRSEFEQGFRALFTDLVARDF